MKGREKSEKRVEKLQAVLKDRRSLLIVMQDYPDPDAIAAAASLRFLANALAGIQCTLSHGGPVGRAENRALVKYLSLNLRLLDDVDVSRFDAVAIAQHKRVLDGIFQFADIARPGVVHEQAHGFLGQTLYGFAGFGVHFSDEMVGQ